MIRCVLLGLVFLVGVAACDDPALRRDGAQTGDGAGRDLLGHDGPPSVHDGRTGDGPRGDGGDTYLPWEGGAAYYGAWKHGPPSDPSFFPIAVWLQSESNAQSYKAIGVNLFIGLWEGPTEQQLSGLKTAGMRTMCAQDGVWSSHLADATITGWTQDDEPDNAQPDGKGGYGPCIDPSVIVTRYNTVKKNDPDRPVYINFGQGVANENWVGRGVCTGKLDMYPSYAKGADIISFDIYPVNETDVAAHDKLWLVATGIDRLRQAVAFKKPVWSWLETTAFNDPKYKPTAAQVKAEVWMTLVHGALGVGYFCHVFQPSFIEAGLLADPTIKAAVAAINQRIQTLAPVLNTPSLASVVKVSSSDAAVPVDVMAKRQGGSLHVFAVAMRPGGTTATFTLAGVQTGSVEVLDEGRSLKVSGGAFSDTFAASYAVHLYRITTP